MKPFPATLDAFLTEIPPTVDQALSSLLPPVSGRNAQIVEAMRYTVFAGGKRFRPCLCLLACHAVGEDPFQALDCACAFEFVHSYSLIHDDLPAMDNADLRRGRPSNHKAFGEAMAILAGDGLLTLAFEVLGSSYPSRGSAISVELARGAGFQGMIAGQVADILGAGASPTREDVETIHRGKTGALITASLRAGGIVGGGSEEELKALTLFGRGVGLAFQIVDDILDETQESSAIGKSAGSDQTAGKITYPAVFGLAESRDLAYSLTEKAVKAVADLPRSGLLRDLARTIVRRMT